MVENKNINKNTEQELNSIFGQVKFKGETMGYGTALKKYDRKTFEILTMKPLNEFV